MPDVSTGGLEIALQVLLFKQSYFSLYILHMYMLCVCARTIFFFRYEDEFITMHRKVVYKTFLYGGHQNMNISPITTGI